MLILICGHSRSGKTTFSQRWNGVCRIIHLDLSRCANGDNYTGVCMELAQCEDKDIVVEGIYNTSIKRKRLLRNYKNQDDRICIWLDTPDHVLEQRNKTYNTLFEPPTLDEGWTEIINVTDYKRTDIQ